VRPLDVDGVRTVAVGTVLWAITFVVLALFRDDLDAEGVGWWMWTCLAGVGLGLLGLEYTRKRRDAIARARLREEADREDEPALTEPAAAPVESEPVPAEEPEPVRSEPVPAHEPVPAREPVPTRVEDPEPVRVEEPEPVRAEPVRAEPERVHVERERVRVERGPVRVEPEPVATGPEVPPAAKIGPPAHTKPEPLEVTTSEWADAGLLDIEPPVPAPRSPSRRARRATRAEEPLDDLDEPLLPIRDDWRRVDRGPTEAPQVESTDDELDDGEAGYRGRRARRP
jgi:outer membrane biosynthesis protein TonB